MQWWALIRDTFRETRDRRLFWVMLLISVITAGSMAVVAFEPGKVSVLFGSWEVETDVFTSPQGQVATELLAAIIVDFIMDLTLGWVGMLLAVVATAGVIPAMMERGGIEILVSKPMPRWQLFLGKYLGCLTFVLFQAAVFVGLTFLVAGVRWGAWIPGYLWSIPLMVLLFSYVFCVTALAGVLFRSALVAILITLGAWIAFGGIQALDDAFVMYPDWKENRRVYAVVHGARWVVPKTQDITYTARRLANAANPTAIMPASTDEDQEMMQDAERVEAARMAISPVYTIGSSLLFEAAVVLLAIWKFSRKDF